MISTITSATPFLVHPFITHQNQRILPGLKTGRALWTSSPSPSPTQSELGVTPGADEGETDDHDTETVVEEEEKLPIKARPRGAQKTHAMLKVQFEDTDEAVSSRGESMEGIVGGVEEDGKDDEYDEASGCD